MTFRSRTFVVLLSLAALIEGATFFAVLNATHDNFVEQGSRELVLGNLVFDNAVDTRARELALGVGVLTSDFGFKSAVAGGDVRTMESALLNQGNRVGADHGLFIGRNRSIDAATAPIPGLKYGDRFPFATLLNGSRGSDSTMYGVHDLNGSVMQLVVAPVFAPDLIGWAAFGFAVNDELANRINRLTNLQVTFVAGSDAEPRIIASTLSGRERADLVAAAAGARNVPSIVEGQAGEFLVLRRSLAREDAAGISAILSIPMSEVMRAYGPLRLKLIAVMIAALALSILGAHLLSNTVAEPLRRFAAAAKRISEGDYREPVRVSSRDELGTLSAAINDMQSDIEKREQQILHQAKHDALTGLPNRNHIADLLQRAVAEAGRQGKTFAVLLAELDQFKAINDTLGHETGDALLVEVGQRLRAACRDIDTVSRVGGDEFLILLEGADESMARRISARILESLDDSVPVRGMQIRAPVSIGIACYPAHGARAEDIQRRADIAMYSARDSGQRIAAYEAGQDENHLRRLQLVDELRDALENDALTLCFQPKMTLATGAITCVEALVRWVHPTDGFISPEEFIPLAEQSGLIRRLTHSVLRQAFASLRRWHDQGHEIGIAINLSALDLLDEELPEAVAGYLGERGFKTDVLTLEITESAVMQDAAQALKVMERLRASGITLSIDDFGTGQSSLAQLKSLPVDELKIDKSFVMEILDNDDDRTIVQSTIDLGHNMGLSVTAEGVECARSENLLRKLGCDVIQGYHLSRPLTDADLLDWLDERQAAAASATENPDNREIDEASNDRRYSTYAL